MAMNTEQSKAEILANSFHVFAECDYNARSGETNFSYINGGSLTNHIPEVIIATYVSGTVNTATVKINVDAVNFALVTLTGLVAGQTVIASAISQVPKLCNQSGVLKGVVGTSSGANCIIKLQIAGTSY